MQIPLMIHLFIIVCALFSAFLVGILSHKMIVKKQKANNSSSQPLQTEKINSTNIPPMTTKQVESQDFVKKMLPVLKENVNDVVHETEEAVLTLASLFEELLKLDPKNNPIVEKGLIALQFQDITRQKLENIVAILQDLSETEHKKVVHSLQAERVYKKAEAQYKTEKERQNHSKHINKVSPSLITQEAINDEKSKHSNENTTGSQNDLGDNVELF